MLDPKNIIDKNTVVNLNIVKEGASSFLDQVLRLQFCIQHFLANLSGQTGMMWTFTHDAVYYPFSYDPETLCPTSNVSPNPAYIHYSPYGLWTVNRPEGQAGKVKTLIQCLSLSLYFSFTIRTGDELQANKVFVPNRSLLESARYHKTVPNVRQDEHY